MPVGDLDAMAGAIGKATEDPPPEHLRASVGLLSVEKSADAYLELLLAAQEKV